MSSSLDATPAGALSPQEIASALASIARHSDGELVTLPDAFAVATARFILDLIGAEAKRAAVLEPGAGDARRGPDASEWALRVPSMSARVLPLVRTARSYHDANFITYVYPRHQLLVVRGYGAFVLRALESAKPDPIDESGRPVPWVPPALVAERAQDRDERDADAHVLGEDEFPPKPPRRAATDTAGDAPFISDETIQTWFRTFVELAGISPMPELHLVRGDAHRLGFVNGRVFFRKGGPVLRVSLVTCPNADLAEILATIVHELAHPLSHGADGSGAHDLPMKRAMADLASRHFGEAAFATVRERLEAPYPVVDAWLATCIRAALRNAPPPRPRGLDDDQTARLLGRLKKLRELASDQRGRPEGITATAAANDLVTTHELGIRGIELASIDPEQLVDRWLVFPDGAVWRRSLAHGIAQHFDVFSLSLSRLGRMHYFGTYADVVAAEYLYEISAARIDRACQAHIDAWKDRMGRTTGGMTRSEKISFCDSAVAEFRRKLETIRAEEGAAGRSVAASALEHAEHFAWEQHARRGLGWSSAGTRTYRENAAGNALGRTMSVVNGVDGGPVPRLK